MNLSTRAIPTGALVLAGLTVATAYFALNLTVSYIMLIVGLMPFAVTIKDRENATWMKALTGLFLVATPLIGTSQAIHQPDWWQILATGLLAMSTSVGATGFLMAMLNQKPEQARTRILGWWIVGIFGIAIPTLGFGAAAVGFRAALELSGAPLAIFGLIALVIHLVKEP